MAERFRDALAALGDAEEAAEVMRARSALSCMRRSPAEKVPT
jgi:predicted XRE-type DNA-binding protein